MRRPLKHGVLHFLYRRLKRGRKRGRKRSALPRELWEGIYKRLPTSDRIRFASVSNNWLSIATAKPPPPPVLDPWLMFRRSNKFWSVSQKRFYRFHNTRAIINKEHKILGASDGWVLITENPQESLIRMNPISNANVMLPPIDRTHIQDMKKLVVVTFGDSVIPAGVFIRTPDYLMACNCGNGAWIFSPGGYSDDLLFYNGKLYNLMVRRVFGIHLMAISFRSLDEQLDPRGEHTYYVEQMADTSDDGLILDAYLVGSCGDVLLVKRFRHPNRFEVFKLLLVDEERLAQCVKLESLEDGQALFWGRDGCISVPVGNFSQFEENHTYFSVMGHDQSYKIGAYSLKDKSFKKMRNLPHKFFKEESIWFFPTIKDSFVDRDRVKGTKSLR